MSELYDKAIVLSPAAHQLLREAHDIEYLAANPHQDPERLEARLYAAAVRYLDQKTETEPPLCQS